MFKFFGHNQFLEICSTSKEVVLFHDNGLFGVFYKTKYVQGLDSR